MLPSVTFVTSHETVFLLQMTSISKFCEVLLTYVLWSTYMMVNIFTNTSTPSVNENIMTIVFYATFCCVTFGHVCDILRVTNWSRLWLVMYCSHALLIIHIITKILPIVIVYVVLPVQEQVTEDWYTLKRACEVHNWILWWWSVGGKLLVKIVNLTNCMILYNQPTTVLCWNLNLYWWILEQPWKTTSIWYLHTVNPHIEGLLVSVFNCWHGFASLITQIHLGQVRGACTLGKCMRCPWKPIAMFRRL